MTDKDLFTEGEVSKHTPGPWFACPGQSCERDGFYVTVKNGSAIWDNGGADGGVCSEQDAHLIAAAPDLLEALEWTANALERSFGRHPVINADEVLSGARTAIAKAKGKSQ